jgi:hypothetical protein
MNQELPVFPLTSAVPSLICLYSGVLALLRKRKKIDRSSEKRKKKENKEPPISDD